MSTTSPAPSGDYPKQTGRDPIAEVIADTLRHSDRAWSTDSVRASDIANALRLAINDGRITEDDLNLMPAPCDLCGGDCFATDEDTIEDEAGVHHRLCMERYHSPAMTAARVARQQYLDGELEVTSEQAFAYDGNDPKNPRYLDSLLARADGERP